MTTLGSLPATAYVKMIDLWLIFAQSIPFFEVLLHTSMDMMRNDGEREINHHGTTITVGEAEDTNDKMVGETLKPTNKPLKDPKLAFSESKT